MPRDLRFTFLGTGTSAGVPALGCACSVCTSANPKDQRLRCSAAIEFTDDAGQHRTILIDCGPDFRAQALRARLSRLDAILFTHNHVDHTFGLDEVRRFNAVQRAPIDIYAEPHTLDFLRRVYGHIFDARSNINDSFVAHLIAHRIDVDRPLTLFGLRITPFRLLHGKLPILGFRFDTPDTATPPQQPVPPPNQPTTPPNAAAHNTDPSTPVFPLAYCTDVSGIPPESFRTLTNLRTLILDALRERHHPTHLTLEQAIRLASDIDAAQTYFIHMAHDLAHDDTQAALPDRMSLAWDGLVLGGKTDND